MANLKGETQRIDSDDGAIVLEEAVAEPEER